MIENYELLYIIPGDKTEEEVKPLAEEIYQLLRAHGAQIVKQDWWGKRKLAYEIKHVRQGYYDCVAFDLAGSKLNELEQALRLHEHILRHQVTRRVVKTAEQLAAQEQLRERIAAKRAAAKDKEVTAAVVAEQAQTINQVPAEPAKPVSGQVLEEKLEEILEKDKIDV